MRWDALFADLESQFEALQEGDLYGEVADRVRAEVGKITVLDRLRGAVDTVVRVELIDAEPVHGTLTRVGKDCLLIETERYEEWLIPVAALVAVHRLGPWAEPASGAVEGSSGSPTCCGGSRATAHRSRCSVAAADRSPARSTGSEPTSSSSPSIPWTLPAAGPRSTTSAWSPPRPSAPSAAAEPTASGRQRSVRSPGRAAITPDRFHD